MAATNATIDNVKIMIQTFFLTRHNPDVVDYFQLIGAIMAMLEPDNESWQAMADRDRAINVCIDSPQERMLYKHGRK